MRKQFLLLATVASISATVLVGCGDSPPKDETDWTYSPPPDFKQQDKQKNGATVFIAEKDQEFAANLQVKAGIDPYDSPKKLAGIGMMKSVQTNHAVVKEQEPYSIPDSEAFTWLTEQDYGGVPVRQRQFIVKKNKVVILFTLTATAKTMNKYDQELADSLKSFKWGRQ